MSKGKRRQHEPKQVEVRHEGYDWGDPEQAQVPCKHGKLFRCDKCGTGERDKVHTTQGGKGKVASLFRVVKVKRSKPEPQPTCWCGDVGCKDHP